MASVKERAGSWWVYWRMGGRNGRKQSCTFPTSKQAEAANALAVARQHKITSDEVYRIILDLDTEDTSAPTVGEWTQQWIAERRELGDIQPDTLDEYVRIATRRVLPQLGHLRLTAIGEDQVRAWVAWLVAQPSRRGGTLAPNTVRRAHSVLHALLAAAVPRWLEHNPAGRVPVSRRRAAGLPKVIRHEAIFLLPHEIELILAGCSPAIRDMVYIAVRTGLRLGEMLVLRVEDVTVTGSRRVIRVRRALKKDGTIGPPKSQRSRRDVSISAEVTAVLRERTAGKRGSDLIFPAPGGGLWNPANLHRRHWVRAVAAAQRCPEHMPQPPQRGKTGPARKLRPDEVSTCDCAIRLHRVPRWHDLRHTHVSLCVEAGWDPVRVQRRVGHESVSTTMDIYGHLWDTEPIDRLDAVERLLLTSEDEVA